MQYSLVLGSNAVLGKQYRSVEGFPEVLHGFLESVIRSGNSDNFRCGLGSIVKQYLVAVTVVAQILT